VWTNTSSVKVHTQEITRFEKNKVIESDIKLLYLLVSNGPSLYTENKVLHVFYKQLSCLGPRLKIAKSEIT